MPQKSLGCRASAVRPGKRPSTAWARVMALWCGEWSAGTIGTPCSMSRRMSPIADGIAEADSRGTIIIIIDHLAARRLAI